MVARTVARVVDVTAQLVAEVGLVDDIIAEMREDIMNDLFRHADRGADSIARIRAVWMSLWGLRCLKNKWDAFTCVP